MSNLELLGLDENEQKIYSVLLVSGQLTKGEIRFATHLNSERSDAAIASLVGKKMLREIPGLDGRYAALLPIGNLKEQIESSVQLIDVLARELESTSGAALSTLKGEIDQNASAFSSMVQAKKDEINSEVVKVANELNSIKEGIIYNVDNKISTFKEEQVQKLDVAKTSSNESILAQKQNVKETINARVTNIQEDHEKLNVELEEIKNSITSDLQKADMSDFEVLKTEVSANLSEVASNVGQKISNFSEETTASLDSLASNSKVHMGKITQIGTDFNNKAASLGNDYSVKLSTVLNTETQELEKLGNHYTEIQQSTINSVNAAKTQAEQTQNEIGVSLDKLETDSALARTESASLYSTQSAQLGEKVNTLISSVNSEFNDQMLAIKTELNSSLNSELEQLAGFIEQQFADTLEKTRAQLQEFNSSFSSKLEENSDNLDTSRKSKVAELQKNVQTSVSVLGEGFKNSLNSKSASEQVVINSLRVSLKEDGHKAGVAFSTSITRLEELSSELKQTTDAVISSLDELKINQSSEITAFVTEQQSAFQDNFSASVAAINEGMDSELTKIRENLGTMSTTMQTDFTEMVSEFKGKLNSQFSNIRVFMTTLYQESLNKLQQSIANSAKSFVNFSDKTWDMGLENASAMEADADSLGLQMVQIMDDVILKMQEQVDQLLDGINYDLTSFVNRSQKQLDENRDKIGSMGQDAMGKASALGSSATASQMDLVQKTMDDYNSKYKEVTGKVIDPTSSLANILGSIMTVIDSTDTPISKTTHIVGKEAIIEYMKDFISRIKSKATILVPSLSYINDDALMKLRSSIQITIISYIDPITHKDWIEKMAEATPNITLRTLGESKGSLPDFVGCEREGEEILLGTEDEGANDYVAIASASEYFVQILGNIVIADYSRGRSKQLK